MTRRVADHHRPPGTHGVALGLFLGTLVSVIVGAWALGTPQKDPVGGVVLALQDGVRTNAQWLRNLPSDAPLDWEALSFAVQGGDAKRGAALIDVYGCGACHIVPGITRAHGTVGPSLSGFRNRAYVAGILPNRPADLVGWLIDPTIYSPQTAMPDLGVTEDEARDMAAYLYTLGGAR